VRNYSILISAMVVLWAGSAVSAKYSGGTGDTNDPYRIATTEDLNDIGNHEEDWNKHFILVNDVNLAEYTGTQFNIIGRWIEWNDPSNKPFTGVFDGNDHKIWSFTWDSNGIDYIGLFRYVGIGGQIKNLGMENVDVNTGDGSDVGGLVGYNYGGTITKCYSSGGVSGNYEVGGLVAYNYGGAITSCYSSASVSGTSYYVGGLVGWNLYRITKCYSTGNVLGSGGVGGLVGWNLDRITKCYATGKVSGTMWGVGGLVGYNDFGTIAGGYSIGSVSGTDDVGSLVGYNYSGTTKASFWDIQTSGQAWSDGGTGKTTVEMKMISTFTKVGWDFVEIWGIGENQTYPFLLTDPAGDSNHDKKVNLADLAILASHWLEER
jgi:hypothetical protein